MNFRQMVGLVLLSIGVVLIVFAFHRMGYIPAKKPEITIITNSPVSPTEHMPTNAPIVAGPKRHDARLFLIAGIGLLIIGGGVAVYFRD